jgi:hypothetical protein
MNRVRRSLASFSSAFFWSRRRCWSSRSSSWIARSFSSISLAAGRKFREAIGQIVGAFQPLLGVAIDAERNVFAKQFVGDIALPAVTDGALVPVGGRRPGFAATSW